MISCNDFKGALLQNQPIAPCHANAIPMSTFKIMVLYQKPFIRNVKSF